MLTAMKLVGNIKDITTYHTKEENYYFSQSNEVDRILQENGIDYQKTESLSYVKVNGNLCKTLGLIEQDTINEEMFSYFLSGKNQFGDKVTKEHKVHGIDLTFSAPKTVSVKGLVFKDKNIIEAHDKAVYETMKEIEESHSFSRPTATRSIESKKMLFVTIRDGYSREHDPHLHTHCIVMNMTEEKGKFTALDMKKIFNGDFNKTFGAIYRQKLAAKLHSLGYSISYTKKGEWRLDIIPKEMEEEFSTRHKQILKAKEKEADINAWRKTRADKNPLVEKEKILQDWNERAEKTGSKTIIENSKEIVEKLSRQQTITDRKDWANKAQYSLEAKQERQGRNNLSEQEKWNLALRRATDQNAIVTEKQIITEYLTEEMRTEQWKDITYLQAQAKFRNQVEKGNIITKPLVYTDNNGKKFREINFYTSQEMIDTEKEYFSYAGTYLDDKWKSLDLSDVDKFVEEYQQTATRKLSDIQLKGVNQIIKSRTFLTMIQGDAGSGKTTALKAVSQYYKSCGIDVVGLAMQGVAAKNLGDETGLRGMTLASYLSQKKDSPHVDKSTKPKVILFDEASMLDSRNARDLFKKAKENGDKVILIGDINQLGAICAGKPFERLVKDAQNAGDLVNFNENYRQKDEQLRQAVDFAKQGRMAESLAIIESKENGITEIQDMLDRRTKVANLYNEDTLIITPTKSAREELNEMIRQNLLDNGTLDKDSQKLFDLTVLDEDGIETPKQLYLAIGEKILFTKNEYKEYDIRNGERATIINIEDKILTVKTEDDRQFKVDTEKFPYIIDYGYALTTYKSQGQTYDKVVIDADTSVPILNDMRNAYVNITRCRNEIQIYTDDKDYLIELAQERYVERDTLDMGDNTIKQTKKTKPIEVTKTNTVSRDL